MSETVHLREYFKSLYGQDARVFRAPGRVNLIGEHTDYNEGFVMPAAIQFTTRVAIAPRGDRQVHASSLDFEETTRFDLDEEFPAARAHWSDYLRGVALMLERAGHRLRGASLAIVSDVPIGSGLSSSAALEVSVALALLANSDLAVDPVEVALLCQRAENEFVGAKSGIMDQFASLFGHAGHALRLDCRSLEKRYVPIPPAVKLVVCDTMVKHALASNEYNLRREQCEIGVRALAKFFPGIRALRDVSVADLQAHEKDLEPVIYRRCRHVVTENERVLAATVALEHHDLDGFGKLMVASHASLRDDYEVSCRELDVMASLALGMKGVYGARMTGGGFGGCTVNLVDANLAEEFARNIAARYAAETGQRGAVYICSAEDGAREDRIEEEET